MSITKHITKQQTAITIDGDFTIYGAGDAKIQLLEDTKGLDRKVLLNLEKIEELDCAGVQVLLMLKKHIAQLGGELRVDKVSDSVTQVCNTLNLSKPLISSEEGGI